MMKKLLSGLATGVFLLGASGIANATTLIDIESEWNYSVLATDLYLDWNTAGYSSFDWANATWLTGQAAFGNASTYGGYTVNTPNTLWAANTDLALTKDIQIDGNILGDLTLNVATDNGFILFVNGQQVAKANAEGFTYYWEYDLTIDSSYFNSGLNTISVLAEDHGGLTYFDMKLAGDVAPVPEPTTMLLLGTGIAGLAGSRIRRKKK